MLDPDLYDSWSYYSTNKAIGRLARFQQSGSPQLSDTEFEQCQDEANHLMASHLNALKESHPQSMPEWVEAILNVEPVFYPEWDVAPDIRAVLETPITRRPKIDRLHETPPSTLPHYRA